MRTGMNVLLAVTFVVALSGCGVTKEHLKETVSHGIDTAYAVIEDAETAGKSIWDQLKCLWEDCSVQ